MQSAELKDYPKGKYIFRKANIFSVLTYYCHSLMSPEITVKENIMFNRMGIRAQIIKGTNSSSPVLELISWY